MIPVVKESWIWILPMTAIAALLFLAHFVLPGLAALLIVLLLIFFFRDPERRVPPGDGLILAPADGRVVRIAFPDEERGGDGISISIFLSLLDVHVNRSPLKGRIAEVLYRKGNFHLAFRDEASGENEQNIITLAHGQDRIRVKQIAGLIARRIVCWVKPGEEVEAGQRIGLIKFGSRVDMILPQEAEIRIREGDKVKGGISIIGYLP
jgi:phosphatidylserine decarboxylase